MSILYHNLFADVLNSDKPTLVYRLLVYDATIYINNIAHPTNNNMGTERIYLLLSVVCSLIDLLSIH